MLLLLLSLFKSVNTQCMDVINLAKGLGMDKVQPQTYLQLQSNCCFNFALVSCSGSKILAIDWNSLRLNGNLNGTAINQLTDLTSIVLSTNFIEGNIPQLPSNLLSLIAEKNKLNGTLPSLPSTMTTLNVDTNSLSGYIPTNLPNSLFYFFIGSNKFIGPVPPMPNLMQYLGVQNNFLSGIIELFPQKLIDGFYYSNLFSGSIPAIPNSVSILCLSANQLEGVIPTLPPTLNSFLINQNLFTGFENTTFSLTTLVADNNKISGVIHISGKPNTVIINDNLLTGFVIEDTSMLTQCDISNNPMLGYPSLKVLKMCVQNNLYTLPLTTTEPSILNQSSSKTSTKFDSVALQSTESVHSALIMVTSVSSDSELLQSSMKMQQFESYENAEMTISDIIEFTTIFESDSLSTVYSELNTILESSESSFDFSQMSEIETIPIFQESSSDAPLTTKAPTPDANTSSPVSIMNIVFLFIALVIICIILVVAAKTMKNPIVKMKLNHVQATTLGGGKEGEITIMSMK
eukprot:NODE_112_length_18534_cov_1.163656.p3 type:complete len:518 gc:universal NODE_112_length_18534_cov_1.163656:14348-12795(-)